MKDNTGLHDSSREIEPEGIPVLRRNVAGIDLGRSESRWVCAPAVDGKGRAVSE